MKKNRLFIATALVLVCVAAFFAMHSSDRPMLAMEKQVMVIDSSYDVALDSEAIAFLAPYRHEIDSLMQPVVGKTARILSPNKPESTLSNMLCDMLVWTAEHFYGEKVDFGIYNVGGMRASFPKGDITLGDILNVAPFENKPYFLTLTAADVDSLFHEIALARGEGVSKEVRLVINKKGELLSSSINGMPVGDKAEYRIATIDFVAQGNDRMPSFKRKKNVVALLDEKDNIRHVIANYFQAMTKQGIVVDAECDGRISVSNASSTGEEDADDVSEDESLIEKNVKAPSISGKSGTVLTFLHTNDTHSAVEGLSPMLNDTLYAGRAGFLRRMAMIQSEREEDADLLLFDSGDFSQGSPFYTLYKGDVEVGLMNRMHYSAGTIGNHEFDYGIENMARLFQMAEFPIVSSNYDFTGTCCENIVKPYLVLECKGKRIGVIGLNCKLDGLVDMQKCKGVVFMDPVEAANKYVKILREQEKVDMVICLTHLGWLGKDSDSEVISQTSGIDLVLGGHSHTLLRDFEYVTDRDGHKVAVSQNGKHGCFVGKVKVEL